MIPFNFAYAKPETLQEAVDSYNEFMGQGKTPYYYGGGTEIITMSRLGGIKPGAVIDLKSIPECLVMEKSKDKLIIGACNSLNTIKEYKLFPLLGLACGRIADHTNQCRITLGGNLCGTIMYRETSLPLMLCDAEVVLFGPHGTRTLPFAGVFFHRMQLNSGEFVSQVRVPLWGINVPYVHVKKTANEKIDYPLVSVAALAANGKIRVAFSGLCEYPFRSEEIERVLNDGTIPIEDKLDAVQYLLPAKAHTSVEGSGEYRLFVLKNTLRQALEELHGTL